MMAKLKDFVWPLLESPNGSELKKLRDSEHNDIKNIQKTDWISESELALEEARRLTTEEDERRRTAESKASNLLIVATALIPLLTYLEAAIWDGKLEMAPRWFTLPILALAVAYLANAGWWALRTVGVGTYHRVYSTDIVRIWRRRKLIRKRLVAETLIAVRRNQETINWKVSASKMTHAFLFRAIVAFSALLLVRITFGLLSISKQPVLDLLNRWF